MTELFNANIMDIQRALALTVPFMHSGGFRPNLSYVNCAASSGGIKISATNGHCLSLVNVPCAAKKALKQKSVSITKEAAKFILSLKPEKSETLKWKDHQIAFHRDKSGMTTIFHLDTLGRKIGSFGYVYDEFDYPNVDKVIPAETSGATGDCDRGRKLGFSGKYIEMFIKAHRNAAKFAKTAKLKDDWMRINYNGQNAAKIETTSGDWVAVIMPKFIY